MKKTCQSIKSALARSHLSCGRFSFILRPHTDFKGEPKPESIFIDIATSNDMTPQELFSFIMKSTGATMPVRGSGKGQGKGQAAQ